MSSIPSQRTNMVAKTTHPCFWSRAIFPKVNVNENGMASISQISRNVVMALGSSKGWVEFAPKKPPPF